MNGTRESFAGFRRMWDYLTVDLARTQTPDAGSLLSRHTRVFLGIVITYTLLTAAVVLRTPVLHFDGIVASHLALHDKHSWLFRDLHAYVNLGLRRFVTQWGFLFMLWVTWRDRSARPLVTFVVAIILLNLSVGGVKLLTGRQGPRGGHPVDQLFAGGDIYPSGHASNAVVMYGVMAMFVAVRYRRAAIAAATFICATVGISTLFINTHWFSDVVGGWLAGALVLCVLPWVVPYAERVVRRSISPVRVAISLLGGAAPLYLNLNFLTVLLGGWLNHVFGGWLAASLILGITPWLTPPLERRIVAGVAALRARIADAADTATDAAAQPVAEQVPVTAR